MKTIVLNEWKMWLRNKIFVFVSLLFVFFLFAANYLSFLQFNLNQENQLKAHKHVRAQWENLKEMNPHGAAHYGSYLFKPFMPLSSFDEGISAVVGNVIRIEGHAQNDLTYSEASQSLAISKLGKLNPSLLLQVFLPLFLVFFTFSTITNERESGRLKLLILQGISFNKLLFGKGLSIWLFSLILLSISLLSQLSINQQHNNDILTRVFVLFFSYGLFFYIIIYLTVFFSAKLKYNSSTLTILLLVWMLWVIFFPKIINSFSEKIYPLPSRTEFAKNMETDRSKGINGHNPSSEREENLKKEILKKYKVDSVAALPINFDGILMQADEEYGNQVWDKHFGKNYNSFKNQKKLYQFSGFINPFASLQNLSMAASANDIYHHLYFLENTENYRRNLIKSLNDKMAYGGSKTGDWDWKVGGDFFKSVEDFKYATPSFKSVINNYLFDLVFLLFWSCVVTFLVIFAKPKHL